MHYDYVSIWRDLLHISVPDVHVLLLISVLDGANPDSTLKMSNVVF